MGAMLASPRNCLICGMFHEMKQAWTGSWSAHSTALLTSRIRLQPYPFLLLEQQSFYSGSWDTAPARARIFVDSDMQITDRIWGFFFSL